jgi:maltose alpha-D-glucosyltransferase / alpha-amylase
MQAEAWYRNAVIYSLSVESFMDGNGDGIGDFTGLVRRLDYIESLGIDALWLAPSQPSPNRDDGYDVADYYGIDPRLGSSGDFAQFMEEADGRGIKVLLDLVPNHTSDRHPWFRDACRDSGSPYRDWYVWSKKRPRDLRSGIVFPGVQRSTWSHQREARAWYFHRFLDFQPDLNTTNPRVREEIRRIAAYWLRLGVAGFRIDAVPFLLEKPVDGSKSKAPHFEYLRELRESVQWHRGDGVLLGEANIVPREDAEYFADGDGLHMIFNFWVNQHLFLALATGDARPLAAALEATANIPAGAVWAHFLRNHDELDLGRLAANERKQVFERFAPDPTMRLYDRGIRRRLAPMLGEPSRLKLAYSLLFALPGAPVLRYGEEIGMGENLRLKERNAIRTPMQWSGERQGGFSDAERLFRPAIDSGPYAYASVNVEDQLRRPDSLVRWMIEMIRVRQETPEVGSGAWRTLPTDAPGVLALRYDLGSSTVVTVHNLDDQPHELALRIDRRLRSLFDDEHPTNGSGTQRLRLSPFGYRWYRATSTT